MAKFKIEIDCDNAAFHDSHGSFSPEPELAFILTRFVEGIGKNAGLTRKIFDSNGNTVGTAKLVTE